MIRSLALVAALVLVHSHSLSALPPQDEQGSSVQTSTAAAAQAPAAVTEPAARGDVDVQVEVVPSDQKGDSKLLVQVDGENASTPVSTDDAAVTDLGPVKKSARVIVVDGDHHALHGATVHFRVRAAAASTKSPAAQEVRGAAPAPPPIPDELRDEPDPSFSFSHSPLLLVSVIGFLLLIGGFLPPMRARKAARIVHP